MAYALGTRPEFIRSARVLRLLRGDPRFELLIVNSGQHYDREMSDAFLEELGLPDFDVDLKVGSADPAHQTAAVMLGTAAVLERTHPDALCVFGDTNSSLGAALAAAKTDTPLVHIEAGCRSYDMAMPEEVNRRLIDHASQLLLAVSESGAQNLEAEAVPGRIVVVGDPLFDVFAERAPAAQRGEPPRRGLLTLHRPENVDDPSRLEAVLDEVTALPEPAEWTFPVHPRARRTLPSRLASSLKLVAPLGYAELLRELARADVCVTDSGGLQKEAFWARVPCVTVRRSTEWTETLRAGSNELASVGDLAEAIRRALKKALPVEFENPYGDGRASERVVEVLEEWLRARCGGVVNAH